MTERSFKTYTKKVCSQCGGTNVLIDAYAEWDFEAQEWVLQNTFDASVCEDCGGETSIDDIEMTGEEANAEIASE
jgi:rRNA maturation endonuclease Nob1